MTDAFRCNLCGKYHDGAPAKTYYEEKFSPKNTEYYTEALHVCATCHDDLGERREKTSDGIADLVSGLRGILHSADAALTGEECDTIASAAAVIEAWDAQNDLEYIVEDDDGFEQWVDDCAAGAIDVADELQNGGAVGGPFHVVKLDAAAETATDIYSTRTEE